MMASPADLAGKKKGNQSRLPKEALSAKQAKACIHEHRVLTRFVRQRTYVAITKLTSYCGLGLYRPEARDEWPPC
jgi:hypothetical protein